MSEIDIPWYWILPGWALMIVFLVCMWRNLWQPPEEREREIERRMREEGNDSLH